MSNPKITIYTDGSYRGKLRTGGYAAFITDSYGHYMLVGDGLRDTTISRMELSAMLTGLSYLQDGCDVTLISDSQYACNIVNNWLSVWAKNNYTKKDGSNVSNQDILYLLQLHISRMHKVQAIWVKSHTGYSDAQSLGNELCDYAAVKYAIQAAQVVN
jgi:ribonuclease HI